MKNKMVWFRFIVYLILVFLFIQIVQRTIFHSIYIWDEAIYANNSLEMAANGNYLLYTNNQIVDHYNTKPPLVIWMQALSQKFFGYNEVALRLPSYLSLLVVFLMFIAFSLRVFQGHKVGVLSVLFILTSYGLIRPHVFLSGDLDAVLVCLTTAINLFVLYRIHIGNIRDRDYYIFTVLFVLGFLCKSTAILLILPGILCALVYNRVHENWLFNRYAGVGLFIFLATIVIYYLIRNYVDPGYWNIVWESEFSRFYKNIMPWHEHPFSYYFENMFTYYFKFPILLIAAAFPIYLFLPEMKYKKLVLTMFLIALVNLVILSIPVVKLEWYDAPLYPVLILMLAVILWELWIFASSKITFIKQYNVIVGFICFLILFGYRAYSIQMKLDERMDQFQSQEIEAAAFKAFHQRHPAISTYQVLMDVEDNKMNHFDVIHYYQKA